MLVGVLGGMGPAATVDFMAKLTSLTEAACDQEHVPVIVLSDPRVPDRSAAICNQGPSPLPALHNGLAVLEAAGAGMIAIPCNTSHFWYETLAAATAIPIVSIIEATIAEASRVTSEGGRVGIIATAGAIVGRVYQQPLEHTGYVAETLDEGVRHDLVEGGIRAVKAGAIDHGRQLLESAIEAFAQAGCESVILGCTEASVALEERISESGSGGSQLQLIDSNRALASEILRRLDRAATNADAA